MLLNWVNQKLLSSKNRVILQHLEQQNPRIEDSPFRHAVIDNAFPKNFYNQICDEFFAIKARGISENSLDKERFSPIGKYDASIWSFPPERESPLLFFYSREWKDYLSQLFGLECTDDINGCFHHHEIGSRSGWIHNDYTAVSFKNSPKGKMNPWYLNCPHQTDVPLPDTHTGVRALAILYYFAGTENWKTGDGGETGLYLTENPSSLVKKVAPINNRLLIFEVSPQSYHAFIKNVRSERNCVVQWLHQDPSLSFKRFGVPYEKWRKKQTLVLTGASGKLGTFFTKKYHSYYDIIGIARHEPLTREYFKDFFTVDITTNAKEVVSNILQKHGKIDSLINAAYIHIAKPTFEKNPSEVHKEFETNFFAPLELSRQIFDQFWEKEGKEKNTENNRCIVNISSGASLSPVFDNRYLGIYSSTKAALNMLTQHLAHEFSPYGIRVNAITPGAFDKDSVLESVSENIAFQIESSVNATVQNLK